MPGAYCPWRSPSCYSSGSFLSVLFNATQLDIIYVLFTFCVYQANNWDIFIYFSSPKPCNKRVNPSIDIVLTVNGTAVKHIKFFLYLGSMVIIDGGALEDVHTHIKKANGASGSCTHFWGTKISFLELKLGCLIHMLSLSHYTDVEHR